MKNKFTFRNIILILILCFGVFSYYNFIWYSSESEKYTPEQMKGALSKKVDIIFQRVDGRSFSQQERFCASFKRIIWERLIVIKDKKKLDLLLFIEGKVDEKYRFYKGQEKKRIEKEKLKITKHTTLILKFWRNGNHKAILEKNKQKIQKNQSVFLFKVGNDLTRKDIIFITWEIKKINPEVLIFIDQEWGWINRYVEFENAEQINKYLSQSQIDIKIKSIFPKKYWYFPSLKKIGEFYDTLETNKDKKYFLEKIAFIRLDTLKQQGINTYGLVLDLDRWNPVISWNARSLSRHVWKYKQLVDAFALAEKLTGVSLYFKHYPWHGAGKVDSHKWILNLIWQEKYLEENLELFHYALWKVPNSGLMVAHAYIPDSFKNKFMKWIQKAAFLLTDDLGMQWYKQSHGRQKQTVFFSTDQIIKHNNLIIVDSIQVAGIK